MSSRIELVEDVGAIECDTFASGMMWDCKIWENADMPARSLVDRSLKPKMMVDEVLNLVMYDPDYSYGGSGDPNIHFSATYENRTACKIFNARTKNPKTLMCNEPH